MKFNLDFDLEIEATDPAYMGWSDCRVTPIGYSYYAVETQSLFPFLFRDDGTFLGNIKSLDNLCAGVETIEELLETDVEFRNKVEEE